MYLLPLGLRKERLRGTTSLFFTIGNAPKAVPWLLIEKSTGTRLDSDGALRDRHSSWSVGGWQTSRKFRPPADLRVCYGLVVVTR